MWSEPQNFSDEGRLASWQNDIIDLHNSPDSVQPKMDGQRSVSEEYCSHPELYIQATLDGDAFNLINLRLNNFTKLGLYIIDELAVKGCVSLAKVKPKLPVSLTTGPPWM